MAGDLLAQFRFSSNLDLDYHQQRLARRAIPFSRNVSVTPLSNRLKGKIPFKNIKKLTKPHIIY